MLQKFILLKINSLSNTQVKKSHVNSKIITLIYRLSKELNCFKWGIEITLIPGSFLETLFLIIHN